MRRKLICGLATLLLAVGCGGDGGTSPPVTGPTTEPSAPTTSGPAAPATTSAPGVNTTIEPPATEMAVLRAGGLGPVDFGAPAQEAIAELTDVLGAPDRVEPIGPLADGCVEGASWLECVRGTMVIDGGQLAVWDSYGLEVALVDTTRGVWPQEQTALQFEDWHATVAPGDSRLVTEDGLSPGMTVGELRRAVPGVEFTSNEGQLDSFRVTGGTGGGYWGRLDWVPATTDIERSDVAAVQVALNEHDADLVVDGEWGPKTEAAWIAFLTDHGIEPVTPQLWLTAEIGQQLGLPPDDVIVATIEPRPSITTTDSLGSTEILRADGLGPIDFGTPAEDAFAVLVDRLGPPDSDSTSTELECALAIEQTRAISWNSTGLHVLFTDWPGSSGIPPAPLHFASWSLDPNAPPPVSLTTADGIGIGSSAGHVRALPNSSPMIPDVTQWGFRITEQSGSVSGAFDWSINLPYYFIDEAFAIELQQALNRHGANLAVDGIVGSRTIQALTDFAEQQGVEEFSIEPAWNSIELSTGVLEVFWLLGLPPDDAPVASMWAGDPSTCN
jgi:peptidoglycan hydrolase-like protein with peptidoglycan-binding domain